MNCCNNNRNNSRENFVQIPETHVDQVMQNVYDYNYDKDVLHPAPYPLTRTAFDLSLLSHWTSWQQPALPTNTWIKYPYKNQPYMDASSSTL